MLTDFDTVIALTYRLETDDDGNFTVASANANTVGSIAIGRERARQVAIAKAMELLLG